ncbi:MAG: type II toxin-antitoxin system VapC family toxin [Magnetococcales bacterium]|nr:type II toxin-antitoxin system VapC family toxin [Magnetococcales bacterium]
MSGIEWLLDTNMVLGLLKGHPPALVMAEQSGLVVEQAAISQITRMELLGFPRLTDEEETAIRSFVATCHVILLDEEIEQRAIRLRRAGSFKLPDAIIAATAIIRRLRLLSLDRGMSEALDRLPKTVYGTL